MPSQGTLCDDMRCPAEAVFNAFSMAILFFEILLVALASAFLLQWNQSSLPRWFRRAAIASWTVSAAIGLGFGLYCDVPLTAHLKQLTRSERAMRGNRCV